jgi:predicted DNA-binding transcriptional regulator YafY
VSERTIYRDVRDLMASGVPIDGEAGIGYAIRKGFDLPPLMFSHDELHALALGARIVESWADPALANAARSLLSKVDNVLPAHLKGGIDAVQLFSPMVRIQPEVAATMAQLRSAIDDHHKVRLAYRRADGEASQRIVWPLGLFFWGHVWTLGAWCELRAAFRSFRLDRIDTLIRLDAQYATVKGRTLDDFIRYCKAERFD